MRTPETCRVSVARTKIKKTLPECELALVRRGSPPFLEDVGRLELVCRHGLTQLEDAEPVGLF